MSGGLRVAAVRRDSDPLSVRNYFERVTEGLAGEGVTVLPVAAAGPLPAGCDLAWDPGFGIQRVAPALRRCAVPVVVTVHGVRLWSLPWWELVDGLRSVVRECRGALRVVAARRWLAERVAAVVAVSRFGAAEAARAFRLAEGTISPIHHGVDHRLFHCGGAVAAWPRRYFLAVAQYQPKKNVARVIAAYARLPAGRPDLVLVLPGYRGAPPPVPGVFVVREAVAAEELAQWYRGAVAFLFPSLHETFGMPIVEAMACGCPVVTSRDTACAEVAGEAALLVDPRSVAEIAAAMALSVESAERAAELKRRGLARAAAFTWEGSARRHHALFRQVAACSGAWR